MATWNRIVIDKINALLVWFPMVSKFGSIDVFSFTRVNSNERCKVWLLTIFNKFEKD